MRSFQLVLKIVILCSATSFSVSLKAQTLAGLALKNLERQKWQRAGELLSKALSKDSLNVTAKYVLAQYFFSDGNPAFNIDSAYRYTLQAKENYSTLPLRQRERLRKFPLDSLLIVDQRTKIEAAAFDAAAKERTESALNHFVKNYTSALALPLAITLRDSVAYSTAAALNTHESFQHFLLKYPRSELAGAAQQNYEKILFEVNTSDQSLSAYTKFLEDYPATPYRRLVEQTIFEYVTASGEPNEFIHFIDKYPTNAFVKKAKDILFHLIPPSRRSIDWPERFSNDSTRNVLALDGRYLVPFYQNKKYGLMDSEGHEIIPARLDSLDEQYHCGNIDEDVIAISSQLLAKNGSVIWQGPVNGVEDIGGGFLLVKDEKCKSLLHKSGFFVGPTCIDEARLLNNKIVALHTNDHWSLWTLAGRQLLAGIKDIGSLRNVVRLKHDTGVELITIADLCILPTPPNVRGGGQFDSAEAWSHNLILVRRKNESALLDQSLNLLVPFGNQTLTAAFFGAVASDTSGARAFNMECISSKQYKQISTTKRWLAAKDSAWILLDPVTMQKSAGPYDTIRFLGSVAVAANNDSSHIYLTRDFVLRMKKVSDVEYIPVSDSAFYLVVVVNAEKNVYDHRGQRLFSSSFDKLQFAGGEFFIGHKKEKKALLTRTGRIVLPPVYDAIGTVTNGKVSLLKSMRFGMYDCNNKKLIVPTFEKNLAPYNSEFVSANKNGLYGLINWKSKHVTKFEFSEIQYWNDTTMLVRKNSRWMLYEIKTGAILVDEIKDVRYIRNKPNDKLAIVYAGTSHGVIHNHKGTIIPVSFTDLVNIGSAELPMYFTEKHVEEASIFVVIYYDHAGNLLRKAVYDQTDYDSIFCHSN